MAYEIERKYLLANSDWKKVAPPGLTIKQGYLNLHPERTVRVRLTGDKAWLTIKGKTIKTTRLEFEYEIPRDDAIELLDLCEKPLVEKIRYKITQGDLVWEIDEFEGENKGLVIAETELKSEDQTFDLPDWIGIEVSHDAKYYNSNLILQPFSKWNI